MSSPIPPSARLLHRTVAARLQTYEPPEAQALAFVLLDERLGLTKTHVLADRALSVQQCALLPQLERDVQRLEAQEPIQYVLGYTHFCGRTFLTDRRALIPRPETEELVAWIAQDYAQRSEVRGLDVGTGTGCIAICLAAALPPSAWWAVDVSEEALALAQENAARQEVKVQFQQLDILNGPYVDLPNDLDILVSNPPYIPQDEAAAMAGNVTDFEPNQALFVPNQQPLLFYEALLDLAHTHLKETGKLYFEIHEKMGTALEELCRSKNWNRVELRKDFREKVRMAAVQR